jgi:hypothetical protein
MLINSNRVPGSPFIFCHGPAPESRFDSSVMTDRNPSGHELQLCSSDEQRARARSRTVARELDFSLVQLRKSEPLSLVFLFSLKNDSNCRVS